VFRSPKIQLNCCPLDSSDAFHYGGTKEHVTHGSLPRTYGSYGGSATAGQYTLSGTPMGTSWSGTPPPAGETANLFYDGTSDGTYNYTVEYSNYPPETENVIATDLNWQSPVTLFSIPGVTSAAYLGITYDPNNNSLWVSGWQTDVIADYSLTGTLLSSFATRRGCLRRSWRIRGRRPKQSY